MWKRRLQIGSDFLQDSVSYFDWENSQFYIYIIHGPNFESLKLDSGNQITTNFSCRPCATFCRVHVVYSMVHALDFIILGHTSCDQSWFVKAMSLCGLGRGSPSRIPPKYCYPSNIVFMFDRCRHSIAAVIPVSYGCDSFQWSNRNFRKIGNSPDVEINERNCSILHPSLCWSTTTSHWHPLRITGLLSFSGLPVLYP